MTYYSPSYIFQLVLLRVNYHVSTWLTPDRRAQETPYELIKHMLAFFLTARRTPLDFGMIIARNPSSRSVPRTMIGVEGFGVASKFTYDGVEVGAPCIFYLYTSWSWNRKHHMVRAGVPEGD